MTRPGNPSNAAAVLPLAAGAGLALTCSLATPSGTWGVLAALTGAVLAAFGLLFLAGSRQGWRQALLSPLAAVTVILVCIFALRPAGLLADVSSVSYPLAVVEFTWADLTRTVALWDARLCCAGHGIHPRVGAPGMGRGLRAGTAGGAPTDACISCSTGSRDHAVGCVVPAQRRNRSPPG